MLMTRSLLWRKCHTDQEIVIARARDLAGIAEIGKARLEAEAAGHSLAAGLRPAAQVSPRSEHYDIDYIEIMSTAQPLRRCRFSTEERAVVPHDRDFFLLFAGFNPSCVLFVPGLPGID